MSRKIGLHILGRRFDVDVEDSFADFLEEEMVKDFNIDGNNDAKKMLQAYVKKSYELYQHEQEIEKILENTKL